MKLSPQELDLQLQRLYSKFWSEKPESLRQFLLDSPTHQTEVLKYFDLTTIRIKGRHKRDLERLAILSWYFPEEIRILVQLNLKEIWDKQDKYLVEKEILLSSKTFCLAWILSESGWTECDFFGNVLNKKAVSWVLQGLSFKRLSQKKVKKYTGWCRGYQESNRGAPRSFPPELEKWVVEEEVIVQKELKFQVELFQCIQGLERFLAA